jgi:hypothetical protein
MKKTTLFLFIILLALATMGSSCGSSDQGFSLQTQIGVFFNGFPVINVQPDVEIYGYWAADLMDATGTREQLPSFTHTNGFGLYAVPDGRRPSKMGHRRIERALHK